MVSTNSGCKKICINASNLHSGGGVQVAVSFIFELSQIETPSDLDVYIMVSTKVHENLLSIGCDLSSESYYEVYDSFGISALWSGLAVKLKDYDVVFTVFGPLYVFALSGKEITGFAQAWISSADDWLYRQFSFFYRAKARLKYAIQLFFFRKSDKLIVELDHVRNSLIGRIGIKGVKIEVVHNCLSSLYLRPDSWRVLCAPIEKRSYSIGFVARDYPHKNIDILPSIKQILLQRHGLAVDFFVTLTPDEWSHKSTFFKHSIVNAGALEVSQCPTFYSMMDAVIFPSLLECFSATPLEAMAMNKPLFASDRGFVRDVCGEFAFYFDPSDPDAVAEVIATYIMHVASNDGARLAAAKRHAFSFSDSKIRALRYVEIIRGEAFK